MAGTTVLTVTREPTTAGLSGFVVGAVPVPEEDSLTRFPTCPRVLGVRSRITCHARLSMPVDPSH